MFSKTTTENKGDDLKVFVRVGPYNVNPETAIDQASVISHEYGHSLGLPDYYSTGSRETYGDWNLMASDHSQNMDVFGNRSSAGSSRACSSPASRSTPTNWSDTRRHHRIDWKTPDGTAVHADRAPTVHNGQAYGPSCRAAPVIDPRRSRRVRARTCGGRRPGNDFGCAPTGGHNLDIALPELADCPRARR